MEGSALTRTIFRSEGPRGSIGGQCEMCEDRLGEKYEYTPQGASPRFVRAVRVSYETMELSVLAIVEK